MKLTGVTSTLQRHHDRPVRLRRRRSRSTSPTSRPPARRGVDGASRRHHHQGDALTARTEADTANGTFAISATTDKDGGEHSGGAAGASSNRRDRSHRRLGGGRPRTTSSTPPAAPHDAGRRPTTTPRPNRGPAPRPTHGHVVSRHQRRRDAARQNAHAEVEDGSR